LAADTLEELQPEIQADILSTINNIRAQEILDEMPNDEIADILEEVIIIKAGTVVLKSSVEELLSSAYTISGEASKVEKYIADKEFMENQTMGKFKSVTVLGNNKNTILAKELDLEIGKAELQKLFISLTNS